MITFACNPEDEFSMTFPSNIESYWFTSDTAFQNCWWGLAHICTQNCFVTDTISKIDLIVSLADSVYNYFTTSQGIYLTNTQTSYFDSAKYFQYRAYNNILSKKTDSIIYYLNQSLDNYKKIALKPVQTLFFDDFENGNIGWSHGGVNDEWELGTPTHTGPSGAYSGNNCWGTDIDSLYGNNSDCWLLSPSVNLNNLSYACLSVKIYNDVEDSLECASPKDKLWIEGSTDNGATFFPVTTYLGGVIDFNTGVPKVGGWSRLVLDLTPYIGSTIRIRFHFASNSSVTRPGSYIDNVSIYGRETGAQGIAEHKKKNDAIYYRCYPNPASGYITIEISGRTDESNITISDITGQEILKKQCKGNRTQIDISHLINGIYFLKIRNEYGVASGKIIKE